MFQFKFKTILIAAVIAALSIIVINISEAASITSLSTSVPDDWGDGANVTAHLSTDEDIHFIDWHVNNNYLMTSLYGEGTTFVNVDLGSFTGSLKGEKYDIRAVVQFVDSSDEDANDTFKVYKPVVKESRKQGVDGAAYLYSITYDGSSISMSGYIYGYNPTNRDRDARGKFRLTVLKNGEQQGEPVIETPKSKVLKQGESYGASGSPSKSIGTITGTDKWTGDAYVRIFVGVPTWNVISSVTFDKLDN